MHLLPRLVMEASLDTRRQRRLTTLLLLCFFIGNVVAYCPTPEGSNNMVLTDEALLMNDFPDGSEVTLECGHGYEKESGSGIINCIGDKWTVPDLICKRKDCGRPKAEPHMKFIISGDTLFGSVINVKCIDGYRISGSSFKHCYANGWFGKAKCNIVTCDKPAEVENAESSWKVDSEPEHGQSINFTCNAGYAMFGNDTIMCTKTGEYDNKPPLCISAHTEDKFTTKCSTSAPATTEQAIEETFVAKGSTAAPSSHRTTAVTARPATIIATLNPGDRVRPSTTSVLSTSPSLKDQTIETINISKDKGYAAVISSVVVVTIVLIIAALFLNKFLLRRKGSYDTGEDMKPESLPFQAL